MEKPEWIEEFLSEWKLAAPVPAHIEPVDIVALRELRILLRRMAGELASGKSASLKDMEALNTFLASGPVIRQVQLGNDSLNLSLDPLRHNWLQVMAEIAASFANTLCEGEGSRIRICDNPDCLWVFYDDTRNRSKRYCDDKVCGNLMKVRRFRARKKAVMDEPALRNGE